MAARLRCALYTRKSSEEGLEQSFNSLHAQREACEAYVLSQAGEGWVALPQVYDDGGFSGGSMERPGLKALLADIDAGLVDVVVVYKVDRLTRSLMDFAKIVEAFDKRGVSFVSVTQAFNTTTSMGRLTLNVLLSFAQFEREVTGERIRDKIAASKAKGMWMGGKVPLGYDAKDRALVVNDAEAAVVRRMFDRYAELKSARGLAAELKEAGIRSKQWTSQTGKTGGGYVMRRGAIFHILRSRLYLGEIEHKGVVHKGLHSPIITQAQYDAVTDILTAHAEARMARPAKAMPAALIGKLFDPGGVPMTPTCSYGRAGRLYRYYISRELEGGAEGSDHQAIRRVSAPAIESFLVQHLSRITGRQADPSDLELWLRRVELRSAETHLVLDVAAVFGVDHPDLALTAVKRDLLKDEQAVAEVGEPSLIRIVLPRRFQSRGGRKRIIQIDGERARETTAKSIVSALRRGHADLVALSASPMTPADQLKHASAPSTQHDRRVARLAYMAPALQREILAGRISDQLMLRRLLKTPMPLAWADQTAWFTAIARLPFASGVGRNSSQISQT
jgi:site-specific DNA recombinase